MADGESNLLLRMGLDLSPVKAAADTIKTTLNSLNELADTVKSAATGAAASQGVQMKELRTQAEAAVVAAKQAIAEENAKAATLKTQTLELGKQAAQQKLQTAESQATAVAQKNLTAAAQAAIEAAKVKLVQEKASTAEIQKQTALLRQQALEKRAASGAGGGVGGAGVAAEGGMLGGLGESITAGLLGEGMAGKMAGGLLAGTAIATAIMLAGEAIEGFLTKLREVSKEAGKLTILEDEFKKLATGAGVNATVMLDRLGTATEGLVSKVILLKTANAGLKSPVGFTSDQVVNLARDMTVLSEAAGNTAEQGMGSLSSALARNRPMMLSMITQTAELRNVMRDLPPGLSAAQRSTVEWTRTLEILDKKTEAIEKAGGLPQTLEQLATRMHVAADNVMTAFGVGMNKSAGMQEFIRTMNAIAERMGGLQGVASKAADGIGNALGNVSKIIKFVSGHVDDLTHAFQILEGVAVGALFYNLAGAVTAFVGPLIAAATSVWSIGDAIAFVTSMEAAWAAVTAGITAAFGLLLSPILLVSVAVGGLAVEIIRAKDEAAKFSGMSATWSDTWVGAINKVNEALRNTVLGYKDLLSLNLDKFSDDMDAAAKNAKSMAEYVAEATESREMAGMRDSMASSHGGTLPKTPADNMPSRQEEQKQAQERMQLQIEDAKLRLQMKKSAIAEEQAVDEENYKYQHESLQAHYDNMRKIAQESLAAAQEDAEANYNAAKQELTVALHDKSLTQTDYDLKMKIAHDHYLLATEAAERAHAHALVAITNDQLSEEQKLRIDAINKNAALAEEEIKHQQALSQKALGQGKESPDEYFQKQVQYITDSAVLAIDKENQLAANRENNAKALQDRAEAVRKIIQDAENHLEDLVVKQPQVYLQNLEKAYELQQKGITEEIGAQKEEPGGLVNPALYQQMLVSLDQYKQKLLDQLDVTDKTSNEWTQIADKIDSVTQQQIKYNNELLKSTDFVKIMGQGLSGFPGLVDAIFAGATGKLHNMIQGLTSGLSSALKSLDKAAERGRIIAGGRVPEDPREAAMHQKMQAMTASAGGVQTGLQNMVPATQQAIEALKAFASTLYAAVVKAPPEEAAAGQTLEERGRKAVYGITPEQAAGTGGLQVEGAVPGIQTQAGTGGMQELVAHIQEAMSNTTQDSSKIAQSIQQLISYLMSTMGKQLPSQGFNIPIPPTKQASMQPSGGGTTLASTTPPAAPTGGDPVQQFTTKLVAGVDALTDFVSAITKSTSALGGAISGGIAGAGLGETAEKAMQGIGQSGQAAGQAAGQAGSAAGAAGSAAGSAGSSLSSIAPFMPAVGAAIGVITGLIAGAKNAAISSEMSELNTQYTSLMDAFHSNTDNLNETIIQMQGLIVEAQQAEADSKSSKKGGSQFKSLVSQYTQELSQLQDQQSSILSDMETQLDIFSAPTGMQTFLSNIEQIIQNYDKFAGAASNAMQLAEANSWLTDSLSSYTTQMENTFVNDEESGIGDALSLNQLLSDRSTLLSNLNDSIMGILEAGVLTRQQTTAETKGQQVEKLETQGSSQLTSIDQQISLEQYKVAVETSLFNLAMTSMGLEAQLLQLQEGQASQSLAAISALQTLINSMQSGNYNFSTMQQLLNQLGYGGVQIQSPTLSTVAGTIGSTSNAAALDNIVESAYNSRATLGYAGFNGANL